MKALLVNGQNSVKAISLNQLSPDSMRWGIDSDRDKADILTLYESIPWLNRGVKARCNALAGMPYALHKGLTADGEEIQNPDTVLPKGMEIDLHDLIFTFVFHRILFGAAYAAKHRNAYGMDKALRIFHPTTIKPKYDRDKGLIGFERRIGGETVPYSTDEMVWSWVANHRTETGPGPSDAQVAANAAGVLFYIDKFGNRYFAAGAQNNMLILLPAATPDQEKDRVQNWLDRAVAGVRNAFKTIAVAANDIKTVALGTEPKNLQMPELTTGKREDIATALGVPQTLLFSNAANYATSRQDDLHFYDKTVKPEAYMVAKALNKHLFNELGYTLVFHPERMEIYQQLEAEKSTGVSTLYKAGIMTLAEARTQVDLPAVPGSDSEGIEGSANTVKSSELLAYHLEQGVVTKNEARAMLGLPEMANDPSSALQELQTKLGVMALAAQAGIPLATAAAMVSLTLPNMPETEQKPAPQLPAETATNIADSADNTSDSEDEVSDELKRWKAMATKRIKEGKPEKAQEFKSDVLPLTLMSAIRGALEALTDAGQVSGVFDNALEWKAYP